MRKIRIADYPALAVFLMDCHSGQSSRGYRLLCRLNPQGNWSSQVCQELRETECYQYLMSKYFDKV